MLDLVANVYYSIHMYTTHTADKHRGRFEMNTFEGFIYVDKPKFATPEDDEKTLMLPPNCAPAWNLYWLLREMGKTPNQAAIEVLTKLIGD